MKENYYTITKRIINGVLYELKYNDNLSFVKNDRYLQFIITRTVNGRQSTLIIKDFYYKDYDPKEYPSEFKIRRKKMKKVFFNYVDGLKTVSK